MQIVGTDLLYIYGYMNFFAKQSRWHAEMEQEDKHDEFVPSGSKGVS